MIISPAATPTLVTTAPACSSRPHRARRSLALAAVGGLLAGMVGLTSVTAAAATSSSASLVADWSYGTSGGFGRGGSYGPWSSQDGAASGTTPSTTVDSRSATSAESKGVALIDTVLTDGEAAGTGIVLTSDGEILTNYHVVEGSTSIRVTIASTGETYTATVVGHDQSADIALLQLKNASGLTISKIDDDTLKTGDDVTAVGNAGGTGELSAAGGAITDLSTSLTTESEGTVAGEKLKGMLETDADVVAGDSGGPLIDAEHEVVGIDTAASSGREINGYAIPIDTALAVVSKIQTDEETAAVRIGPAAFLGVELGGADSTVSSGATIAGVVEGDAADDAGLTAGDTITKIGTSRISDATDLSDAIAAREPGDRTKITWVTTDGSTQSAAVSLGSSPVN